MIWGIALIVGLVTATYFINACKIRFVTEGRALASAVLEGLQGFLFVFALIRMIDLTSSAAGALAYVAGAFLGTAAAVRASGRRLAASVCRCAAGGPVVEVGRSPGRRSRLSTTSDGLPAVQSVVDPTESLSG